MLSDDGRRRYICLTLYWETRNIDLKRRLKFKLRKDDSKPSIKNREVFIGRTYADFKQLNPGYFCEMDTVMCEGLNGKTPYQASLKKFGPEILRALQLKHIPPDDVILTPKLLK